MKCKYCGSEISPRDHYCPECGHINEDYLRNDTFESTSTSDDPFEEVYSNRRVEYYEPSVIEENHSQQPRVSPVFGILSLIFGIMGAIIPALILGIIGLKRYPKDDISVAKYRRMCIAGIILGIIMFIVEIIIDVIYFIYLKDMIYVNIGDDSFSMINLIQL